MKILMTSDTYFPSVGGAEIHIYNLIKELEKNENLVYLFTTEQSVAKELHDVKKYSNIPWGKRNIFKIIKEIWKLVKKAEIIHCHYCYRLSFLTSIIAKLNRKPIIITLHGMGILNHPNGSLRSRCSQSIYRKVSLMLADKIISTSDDLADFAYQYVDKKKIKVVPNGVDITRFKKIQNEFVIKEFKEQYKKKKIILTVRGLRPKCGIHYLIESLPYILKQRKDIVYLVIGKGRMENYLRKRVKELCLQDCVRFLGAVPNEKIPLYLAAADVVVFPSTAESVSISCLEAMAMAKPIVASRVGGLIELIGRNNNRGLLVKLVDWEQCNYDAPKSLSTEKYQILAENILFLLENEKKAEILGLKAQEYCLSNFSWEILAPEIIKVYNSALKNYD